MKVKYMNRLRGWLRHCLCVCGGAACSLMWVLPAWADNCDSLESNPEWSTNFEALNTAYKNGEQNAALQYSSTLEAICDQSPVLNYTIAHIHKNKGDNEKYLFYLQKATQNTERFSVNKNLLDKMWDEKYISAHPEASPEAIEKYNSTIEEQKSQIDSLNLTVHDLNLKLDSMQGNLSNSVELYKKLMWTGTGVGIGGIVLTGIGAALVGITKGDSIQYIENKDNPLGPHQYKNKPEWMAGWGLLGAGAALTIAGATLAGVFGYKYLHYNDQVDITFAPNGALINIVF